MLKISMMKLATKSQVGPILEEYYLETNEMVKYKALNKAEVELRPQAHSSVL